MATGKISERARVLLKALVERHIRDGQPVGSSTLLQEAGLPVSAATIRNVMASGDPMFLGHDVGAHLPGADVVLVLDSGRLDYIHDMVDCLDVMERVEAVLPKSLRRRGAGGADGHRTRGADFTPLPVDLRSGHRHGRRDPPVVLRGELVARHGQIGRASCRERV